MFQEPFHRMVFMRKVSLVRDIQGTPRSQHTRRGTIAEQSGSAIFLHRMIFMRARS